MRSRISKTALVAIIVAGGFVATQAAASDVPPGFEWGDDSSRWADNGVCDDPRFEGTGVFAQAEEADIGKDASDCRWLLRHGRIALKPEFGRREGDPQRFAAAAAIEWGDDGGEYANDGECDDPRFEGPGSIGGFDSHILADASDCRWLFERGQVSLRVDIDVEAMARAERTALDARETRWQRPQFVIAIESIDFGNDSSMWANDGECDDPRFEGPGAAAQLVEADRRADATDCRDLYRAGEIWLRADDA